MELSIAVVGTETKRRAKAMDEARASCRLEGVDLDPAALAVAERFVAGDQTGEHLVEEMVRLPLP